MIHKSRLLLIFLCLAGAIPLKAQDQLKHPKKLYVSPEGKTYIQKSLPVYLKISTSPASGSDNYLLKSEAAPQYTNPMYFDTEGINTIRSPWCVDTATKQTVYPLRDVIFEVYADSYAPKSKIDYSDAPVKKKGDKVYVSDKIKISFSAEDETSGVDAIYYSIDKQPFQKYNKALSLDQEKEYIIQFYAVDNVGNVEEISKITIEVDFTGPETSLKIEGDQYENILSPRTKLILKANDHGVGVKNVFYYFKNHKEQLYSGPIALKSLKPGAQSVFFYGVDQLNNKTAIDSFAFFIDATPPMIVEEIIGNSYVANGVEYSSGRSKLQITAIDNKAGVKEIFYSINGSEYKKYDKPFYLSVTEGSMQLKTYAVDQVNNKAYSTQFSNKANLPYIDLTSPEIDHLFLGDKIMIDSLLYIHTKTAIKLIGNDEESGLKKISYVVDNKDETLFFENVSIPEHGLHEFMYTGYDFVDNSNTRSISFFVDTIPPDIQFHFSIAPIRQEVDSNQNKIDVYPKHLQVYISSLDQEVGVEKITFALNNNRMKTYLNNIHGFSPGKHTLYINAYDMLGNISKKSRTFIISD